MSSAQKRLFYQSSQTYYYSSRFFPADTREAVTDLYAFVRTADDFVDKANPDEDGFYDFRADYESQRPENEIVHAYHDLAATYDFDPSWTEAFLDAMERDLTVSSFDDIEELRTYMYGSAEVIGLMLCKIMDVSEEAWDEAKALGRGMQYINFLRDIAEDNTLGRTYVPQSILDKHGLEDLRQSTAENKHDAFSAMMQEEVQRGTQWLKQGRNGFSSIPWRCRIPIATATDMYAWTADMIQADPAIVYRDKVKPSMLRIIFTGIRQAIYDRQTH